MRSGTLALIQLARVAAPARALDPLVRIVGHGPVLRGVVLRGVVLRGVVLRGVVLRGSSSRTMRWHGAARTASRYLDGGVSRRVAVCSSVRSDPKISAAEAE
jgi:hypothetical protein